MPVYNAERYLDQAIRSIRGQTFGDFELLIMDDGSTDSSLEIAQRHADEDSRVSIINLSHGGYTVALNEGLQRARGTWIARMDADDIALPNRFERQFDLLARYPETALVGTHGRIIGETGKIVGVMEQGPATLAEFSNQREQGLIHLVHPSVVFSKAIVLSLSGYRTDYEPAEDLDLWNRIADDHQVLVVPEPLIHYRIHSSSVSTSRFMEQERAMRRIQLNTPRRRTGQRELAREEFERREGEAPLARRLQRELSGRSRLCYRRGGGHLAAGNFVKGAIWIGLSALYWPPVALGRISRQVGLWRSLQAQVPDSRLTSG